ncbi:MAG TPA: hypothetical protein VNZ22_00640, partial [Bacillota bacterium]|nr:hypothetical protein [Bacillota bacterium]
MNKGCIATLARVALWAGLLFCLTAPKPAAGLGAPGFSAMINFQTNRSTSISNYLIDVGDAFPHTQNNCAYGWNVDNTANAFDRGTISADRRLGTGIKMQTGTNSYYWQIQVPNGIYDVQVLAGDPTDTNATLSGTRYNLNVGTTPAVVDGRPSSSTWWFGTNHIQTVVTNRLLVVSNGPNAVNNRILCISIQQVAPIFWGALVADNPTNWPYYSKAPADYFGESKPGVLGYFESHTGKKISMLLYGLGGFGLPYTNTQGAAGMWARGTIPFWDSDIGSSQSISNVVEGYCDSSITNLALRFKNYGKPMFFCFCREMNGNWYAWSEINKANTNAHRLNPTRYSFTNMWVYVHDKFT